MLHGSTVMVSSGLLRTMSPWLISERSYVAREALDTARQDRVLTVLNGGKLAS
jgi:hypothetical protein